MDAAKGTVLGLLRDAYQRRDLVSLVTFRGEGAEVVLRPTGSVEVARARLGHIPTGGRTPLAAGIETALRVAVDPGRLASHRPLLVLVTDGRATSGPVGADPVDAALVAAASVRSRGVDSVVIDVEEAGSGPPRGSRLGLAARVAAAMGARHLPVTELTSGFLAAVRPPRHDWPAVGSAPMRLLMVAPPGAGKGTQAKLLSAHYDIAHISSGEVFRREVEAGTELGQVVAGYLATGRPGARRAGAPDTHAASD